jgi:hypothetical protein
MRFDPDYRPFVRPERLYIIPLSHDPSDYQVLMPAGLYRKILDLLIQDKLAIHRFGDCPAEAVRNVKDQLGRSCAREPERYSVRMNQVLVAGTVITALGIVNLTLPDPLPLADEILMIGGGAGIGFLGFRSRRKALPLLNEKKEKALRRLQGVESSEDILLTRIHDAMRARNRGGSGVAAKDTADPFELEARWLVECLDLQQLIDSRVVSLRQLDLLDRVIANALPLPRFLTLERKLRKNPKDSRAHRARDREARRYGLSADAFTVYTEFHRLAREILSTQSER